MRLDAEFVEANIYDLPTVLPRQFDIVYTSYGVLWWLPDLSRWAQIVAGALRPGGMFYMCEIHPFGSTLRDEDGRLVAAEEYFGNGSPLTFQVTGSYIQGVAVEEQTEHGWQHSMGEIVTSLLDAGLRIEWLHEFPFACFKMLPSFTSDDDRNWWPPEGSPRLPLLFSVRAYRT